jgi:hypothetical protein
MVKNFAVNGNIVNSIFVCRVVSLSVFKSLVWIDVKTAQLVDAHRDWTVKNSVPLSASKPVSGFFEIAEYLCFAMIEAQEER